MRWFVPQHCEGVVTLSVQPDAFAPIGAAVGDVTVISREMKPLAVHADMDGALVLLKDAGPLDDFHRVVVWGIGAVSVCTISPCG